VPCPIRLREWLRLNNSASADCVRGQNHFILSGMVTSHLIPNDITEAYEVHEWRNAAAVLLSAHPTEWNDVIELLRSFEFRRSEVLKGGGRKSVIAQRIDTFLEARGWKEKKFSTKIRVDDEERDSPTHKVDCFKARVGLEIEWNNKDPFFDRDLNNFRLLFDLRVLDLGVIITRASPLQQVFKSLGKKVADKYGASTTHMDKLLPRIEGGSGGGCPILAFGITRNKYVEDAGPIVEQVTPDDEEDTE
jgi:Restriction endonuclease BglII